MTLFHILFILIFSLLAGLLPKSRRWIILGGSVLALYWLQPATPIRNLDFWLPTITLALSIRVWVMTWQPEQKLTNADKASAALITGLVLLVALTRYLPFSLTPSRPPQTWLVLVVLASVAFFLWLIGRFLTQKPWALRVRFWWLIVLFILLKSETLSLLASQGLRTLMGQSAQFATGFDIRWLGFSYIAFRLMHTLRDRLTGKLPELSLSEYLSFIIFAPALTAGPIDRVQRFIKDLNAEWQLNSHVLIKAGERLVQGLFMKFILADSLALFALNAQTAAQTTQTGWMWLLVYAYTLRIFFDFAGYTHIAIGLGLLFGITLPENFKRPYLQTNLTQFWNSWHITLAQWFRAYWFNPLTRALRGKKWGLWLIILIGQSSSMLLIGLWHGLTWNFVIWGLWHGLGLFIHNRWADFSKRRWGQIDNPAINIISGLLTFQFVALGWVWFALPSFEGALNVFNILLGL